MKMQMVPMISMDEFCDELGFDITDCAFAQSVENDSAVILRCDDEHLDDFSNIAIEEIERYGAASSCIMNELNAIKHFREMGIYDKIIIEVYW